MSEIRAILLSCAVTLVAGAINKSHASPVVQALPGAAVDPAYRVTQSIRQTWHNGTWVEQQRMRYVNTCDASGNPAEVITQEWDIDGRRWVNTQRCLNTYQVFNAVMPGTNPRVHADMSMRLAGPTVSGNTAVRIGLRHSSTVNVRALTLLGRAVHSWTGRLGPGEHNVVLPATRTCAAGMVLWRLRTDDECSVFSAVRR